MAEDTKKPPKRSLVEFQRDKRRAACVVCSLPSDLYEQLKLARARKISQVEAIDWLKEEEGITITRADFSTHNSAHHDTWDEP